MDSDETFRRYPPVWVGPRLALRDIDFEGVPIPERAFVNYCSWASHHLPDVFSEPDDFRPERFTPEARAELPKRAYVPFPAGSRTSIGIPSAPPHVPTHPTTLLPPPS